MTLANPITEHARAGDAEIVINALMLAMSKDSKTEFVDTDLLCNIAKDHCEKTHSYDRRVNNEH